MRMSIFHTRQTDLSAFLRKFMGGMFLLLLMNSCSNLRYLPEGEKLYTGADVKIISENKIEEASTLKKEARKVISPAPNRTLLGLRARLWFYNIAGTPRGKGLRYFLKNTLGEPPVLLSSVNPSQVSDIIDSRLFNKGVFKSVTTFKVTEKEKKAKVVYEVMVHDPYKIDSTFWPEGNDALSSMIRSFQKRTRIRKGKNYDLNMLSEERIRIEDKLKESGYFYFDPDYILFTADTNNENKTVNIAITIKEDVPSEAKIVYRLRDVYVFPDYSLQENRRNLVKDTMIIDDIKYISVNKSIRPPVILRSVFLRPGEIYSRTNHKMTLNRLMGMGVFKFVNVRYNDPDSLFPGTLDAFVYLTPLPKKSVRTEIELVSKSNNFLGPSISIGYQNRNALNGAELLTVDLKGSFETQINGEYKGLFSYEIGPEVSLYVPRFIVPFRLKSRHGYYIPKTRFTIGYDFLKRVQYYDLNAVKFVFGYKWKENELKEHELNPVNINYVRLSNMTPGFKNILDVNQLLRRSFEEQFIVGATYTYTYNQQVLERKRNQTYFNLNIETSGNLISLFSRFILNNEASVNDPLRIAGTIYSQYIRTDIDLRHYRKLGPHSKIVGRFFTGVGYSYGNSYTMPYIKQFYSGGVSSVRAFRSRALGPGVYIRQDSSSVNFYFEQGGDIKLEANLEYRFDMIGIFKGALFCDAGNNWLMRANPAVPGGTFNSKTFLNEIAVGTGFGLRLDANFFVARLDLAWPVRKPWQAIGERWVFEEIKPWSPSWRGENLLLNIAIGYPF